MSGVGGRQEKRASRQQFHVFVSFFIRYDIQRATLYTSTNALAMKLSVGRALRLHKDIVVEGARLIGP